MAARASMASLITMVRNLLGDPSGTSAHFTDDAIQAALDARRQLVKRTALTAIPTPTSSGYEYKDFQTQLFFESDATLADNDYQTITPTTGDFLNGRFAFSTSQDADLYISGNRYDVYGAAADLCLQWLASLKGSIDYSAGRASFKISQKLDNLEAMYKRYSLMAEGIGDADTTSYSVFVDRRDVDL